MDSFGPLLPARTRAQFRFGDHAGIRTTQAITFAADDFRAAKVQRGTQPRADPVPLPLAGEERLAAELVVVGY